MKPSWVWIFQIELLAAGLAIIFGEFFVTALIGPERLESLDGLPVFPLLAAVGIVLVLLAAVIFHREAGRFLRNNRVSAFVIPLQFMLVAILVGMEILLRITIYSQPMTNIRTNWFGSLPAPGSIYVWGREGFAITHYAGMPGEIRTPYNEGEDIILLGDSFLEGLQVADEEKLASVAESALHNAGRNFDLHNLGASGMSMADYTAFIPKYLELYDPSAIVLVIQDNDFIESFHTDHGNHFSAGNGGGIALVSEYGLDDESFIPRESHPVFRPIVFQYGWSRIEQMMAASVKEASGESISDAFNPTLADQQMERLMQASGGVPLIILIYPHAPYIDADRIEMDDDRHETLRQFLSDYPGIILVDPLPELQQLVTDGSLPMGFFNSTTPGLGHLNAAGNEVVGRLLAGKIAEVLK